MDLAIAHDWLLNRRGAEKVLREFCLFCDDLSIFTLFFDAEAVDPAIKQHSIYVSDLDRLPGVKHYYRYLLPWFRQGIEDHLVQNRDLLLSISHAVAKGIPHDSGIPHVCYCLTPMRYIWEPGLYESVLGRSWRGHLLQVFARRLREWDLESNEQVDYIVGISRAVQERVQRVYQRDCEVIYPCIDLDFYRPLDVIREDFYLVVSSLVPQKRIDLVVEAFNQNGKSMVLIGTGPLLRRLARRARPNIRFLGWRSDEDVREFYCKARALILPGEEEFGLVPIEAQACGCPVIAYGEGGVKETVIEEETGLFFREPTSQRLVEVIEEFERTGLDAHKIIANAQRFSRQRFRSDWECFFRKLGIDMRTC